MARNAYIYGRNAIIEALQKGSNIEKIYLSFRSQGASINQIYGLAKKNQIPVVKQDTKKFRELEQKAQALGGVSQGVIALKELVEDTNLDELFELAFGKAENPVVVALDGIEDPQNLGAIGRSVEASGSAGLIITTRNSARVTPAAIKASTGALEMIPFAKVQVINDAIEKAKDAGYKVIATEMNAKKDYFDSDLYNSPILLIIGSEGKGISKEAKEHADEIIKIPMPGKIESLNASVSTAIILFEILRQRLN